jgi:predicted RNA-binding Zn-ribbon protein involved in translation (DUF1610 family)
MAPLGRGEISMATSTGSGVTSSSEKLTFNCPKCQKRWTWKPEIAGKKVKCKCGGVFAVPTNPPSGAKSGPVKVSVSAPQESSRSSAAASAAGPNSQIAPMTKGVKPPKQEDSLYGLAPEKDKPAPRPQQVVAEVVGPAPGKKPVGKIMGHRKSIAAREEEEEGAKKQKMALIFVTISLIFAACMIAWQFGLLDKIFKK